MIVADAATDPLWARFADLVRTYGLRACWSVPIRDAATDVVLGTFAVYHRTPRRPTEAELALVTQASGLAAVAIRSRGAEEALRRSEARFRALVQRATDIVAVLEPHGTRRYVSPAVERTLGYRPEELVGANVLEQMHPEDALRAQQLFASAVAHPGGTVSLEVRMRHRDGAWRWLDVTGTNLLADPSV